MRPKSATRSMFTSPTPVVPPHVTMPSPQPSDSLQTTEQGTRTRVSARIARKVVVITSAGPTILSVDPPQPIPEDAPAIHKVSSQPGPKVKEDEPSSVEPPQISVPRRTVSSASLSFERISSTSNEKRKVEPPPSPPSAPPEIAIVTQPTVSTMENDIAHRRIQQVLSLCESRPSKGASVRGVTNIPWLSPPNKTTEKNNNGNASSTKCSLPPNFFLHLGQWSKKDTKRVTKWHQQLLNKQSPPEASKVLAIKSVPQAARGVSLSSASLQRLIQSELTAEMRATSRVENKAENESTALEPSGKRQKLDEFANRPHASMLPFNCV